MPTQISSSFPHYPYFDDYDPLKFYQKILFKPSYDIQVRELNQLQTILQEQISRFGSSIFKNGSIVLGCDHKINTTCFALTLNTSYDLPNALIASLVSGAGYVSSGKEKVSQILDIVKNEDKTLTFIVNDISEKSISSLDTIKFFNPESKKESQDISFDVISKTPSALIKFNSGVIYLDGTFVQVKEQRKILSFDSSVFSGSIGLTIDKKIERSGDVDVFKIELILDKKDIILDSNLSEIEVKDNFIEFLRVDKGVLLKDIRVPIYSDLEKTLARRTFDESGNYTVRPFTCKVVENLGNSDKFSLEISPGKAYVLGYEFDSLGTRTLDLDRALDVAYKDGFEISTSYGSFVKLENFFGFFDVQTCEEVILLDDLVSNVTFGPGGNQDLHTIGSARVRHVKYLESELWLYLFDIKTSTNKTFLDVKSLVTKNITKANVGQGDLIESKIFGIENSSSLFRFPEENIKSLRDSSSKIKTDYYIQKTFLSTVFNPSEEPGSPSDVVYGTLVLPHNEQFILNPSDFVIVEAENSSYLIPSSVSSIDSLSSQITLKIEGKESFIGDVYAKVRVYIAKEKEKKKVVKPFIIPLSSLKTGDNIELPVLDASKIVSIRYEGTSILESCSLFPNKTKDAYYNSYIIYSGPDINVASNLSLDLEFYERGPSSGFFSVDSYEDYESIPDEKIQNENYKLGSVVDFRVDILSGLVPDAYIPLPDDTFECSYSFYLGRIDKLVATSSKNFEIIRGLSAKDPIPPKDSSSSMTLYTISLEPYSRVPKSVKLKFHENKRYTMRDIGKLEKRIENLEYYTALSLLEKDTKDMEILDENGNSRFKNGFLVDNFKSFKSVEFASKENNCSLDLKEGILRPSFTMDNVNVLYNPFSSSTRRTGDLVTVPYSEVPFVEQLKCSESMNLQPFEVFDWVGTLSLFPEIDEWVDTETAPSVIANQFGETDIWEQIGAKAFSAVWNSWESKILSVPETENLSSLSHTSPDKIQSSAVKKLWNPSVDDKVDQSLLNTYKIWVDNNFSAGFSKTTPDGFVNNQPAIYLDFKGDKVDSSRVGSTSAFSKSKIITNETSSSVTDVAIVSFIREKEIKIIGKNLKPSTRFYCFFDQENVSNYVTPSPLMSDASGKIEGIFALPGGKFKSGEHKFSLKDSLEISEVESYASTVYRAEGLKQKKQSTIISSREPVVISDPVKEEKGNSSISWAVDANMILPTPTMTPTPTPTPSQTPTQTPSPTSTQITTPSPTSTSTPSQTPTQSPSGTPSGTPTPSVTRTGTPTPGPTWTPTPSPTSTPTPTPTPSLVPPFEVYFIFNPFALRGGSGDIGYDGSITFTTSLGQSRTYTISNSMGDELLGPFVVDRSTTSLTVTATLSGCSGNFFADTGQYLWSFPASQTDSNQSPSVHTSFLMVESYNHNAKTKTRTADSVSMVFDLVYNSPLMNPPGISELNGHPFTWKEERDKHKNIILFNPIVYFPKAIPAPTPTRTPYVPPSPPPYNPPPEPPYVPPPSPIPGISPTPTRTPYVPSNVVPLPSPSPSSVACPPVTIRISGTRMTVNSGGHNWTATSSISAVSLSPSSGKDGDSFNAVFVEEMREGMSWAIKVVSSCGSEAITLGSFNSGVGQDPLAESFFVEEDLYPEGIFLSSAELFFKSKSSSSQIDFQIRPSVNGYPSSKEIVPFSEVYLNPEDIFISEDASLPTKFEFASPVFLKPGEYHFVVRCKDTKTKAWISTLGQFELGSQEKRISKNPYSGVLLKSANASTWIPQPESDLKFRLNRCSFEISRAFSSTLEVAPYFGTENVETPKEFNTLRFNVPSIVPKGTSISPSTAIILDKSYSKVFRTINLNENMELGNSYFLKDMRGVIPSSLDTTLLSSEETDLTKNSNVFYEKGSVVEGTAYLPTSLPFTVSLSTTKETVSPFLDIQKMSTTLVKNIISNLSEEDLLSELTPTGGKGKARYITKPVKLNSSLMANKLYVSFAASIPEDILSEVNVKVFYKIYNSLKNAESTFAQKGWTMMGETNSSSPSFRDYEFQTENLVYDGNYTINEFDWFAIKLLLQSNNSAFVPKIKDLRVIALSA